MTTDKGTNICTNNFYSNSDSAESVISKTNMSVLYKRLSSDYEDCVTCEENYFELYVIFYVSNYNVADNLQSINLEVLQNSNDLHFVNQSVKVQLLCINCCGLKTRM